MRPRELINPCHTTYMFSTILALASVVSAVLFVESISMLANRLILCKTDLQILLKHGLERSTKSTASRTYEDIGNLYIRTTSYIRR
jgi:hypothetical protein